jgi:hypothetical protein
MAKETSMWRAYGSRKKRKRRNKRKKLKQIVLSPEARERAIKKWDERERIRSAFEPLLVTKVSEPQRYTGPRVRVTFVSGGLPSLGRRR